MKMNNGRGFWDEWMYDNNEVNVSKTRSGTQRDIVHTFRRELMVSVGVAENKCESIFFFFSFWPNDELDDIRSGLPKISSAITLNVRIPYNPVLSLNHHFGNCTRLATKIIRTFTLFHLINIRMNGRIKWVGFQHHTTTCHFSWSKMY